jgi:predicted adenine nucleotide alpha hydrolase (AANH) superfamily ATPase
MISPGDHNRILLHACCAPCATVPLERLRDCYTPVVYWYNPNIHPRAEYQLRLEDMRKLCAKLRVELIEGPYLPAEWGRAVAKFRQLPERSVRCEQCFRLRMEATAREALARGIGVFTVTLSAARQKDSRTLARIGSAVGEALGVPYLDQDFKKRGGSDRVVVLAREYGLHRQSYCGCSFSRSAAYAAHRLGLQPHGLGGAC